MQGILANRQSLIIAVLGTLLLGFLLLSQNPFVVMGLCVGILALIAVSKWPELALYLLVLSVPGQVLTSLTLGTSRITLTQAAVGLALFGYVGSRVLYRRPFFSQPLPRLLPFFGLYLAAMIVSMAVARSTEDAIAELYRWAVTAFAYLLATSLIRNRQQFWWLVGSLCAGTVLGALAGLKTSLLKEGPPSYAISYNLSRAFGTFDKPNSFAGYIEMGLPLLVALTLLLWHKRHAAAKAWLNRKASAAELVKASGWLLALVFGLTASLGAIFLSFSRGAWLGLSVAALLMLALVGRKAIPVWILGGAGVALFVLGLQTGAIPEEYFSRVTSVSEQFRPFDVRGVIVTDENFAIVERMAMWQAGGNMFLSDPWLGVGIGNYNTRYPEFFADRWDISQGHAHNYYIHAAAETGLVGLLAYLALLIAALTQGWRAARKTCDPALKTVAWGAFGVIFAVAFHNLVENLHVLSMGIHWGAVLALFYLIERFDAKEAE